MKNTVSFETAKRLKEAGFPQPDIEAGQVWYNQELNILVIVFNSQTKVDYVPSDVPIIKREYKNAFLESQVFFAPTATDILAELNGALISWEKYGSGNGGIWGVWRIGFLISENKYNPAEAAAAAWLKIHEKKNNG